MNEREENALSVVIQPPSTQLELNSTSSISTTSSTISITTTSSIDHSERELLYPETMPSGILAESLGHEINLKLPQEFIETVEKSKLSWDEFELEIGVFKIRIKRSPKKEIKYFGKKQ